MTDRDTTPWTQRARDLPDIQPTLVVVGGAARGRRYPLLRAQTTIGRDGADVALPDTGVSRRHAKLIVAADQSVMIMDLGSKNRTLVNGTDVSLATLVPGDVIKLGPTASVQLVMDAPKDAGPAVVLSPRQLEVAGLVAEGLSNAEVARKLGISPNTVARHLDNMYGRLGIRSRTALARWLVDGGDRSPER